MIDASLRRRSLDLSTLVEQCVDDVRAEYSNATIETTVPDSATVVAGDYLGDALHELLENAIVHAETDSPSVVVAVSREDDDTIALSVRDDGPGIPASDREVVLGDRPVTKLDHANGLVRWVVDAYGGDFEIRQPADGGSEVRLVLQAA